MQSKLHLCLISHNCRKKILVRNFAVCFEFRKFIRGRDKTLKLNDGTGGTELKHESGN